MTCPDCGQRFLHTKERHQYRESGLPHVWIEGVDVYRCQCGQEFIQIPEGIDKDIAMELVEKRSLLTGGEVKFLRKWLGLTGEEMASFLKVTRKTVSTWENGALSQPNDLMVRLFVVSRGVLSIDSNKLFETFESVESQPPQDISICLGRLKTAYASAFHEIVEAAIQSGRVTVKVKAKKQKNYTAVKGWLEEDIRLVPVAYPEMDHVA